MFDPGAVTECRHLCAVRTLVSISGDAQEGCLSSQLSCCFFLSLAIYLHKYNHKCMSRECLESVLYVLRSERNLRGGLSRDCKLRFLGSLLPLLFTFCWEKPSS